MARNHASAVTEGNITSSGGDLDISAPEVRWGDRWFELNIPRGDTNGVGEDEVTVTSGLHAQAALASTASCTVRRRCRAWPP